MYNRMNDGFVVVIFRTIFASFDKSSLTMVRYSLVAFEVKSDLQRNSTALCSGFFPSASLEFEKAPFFINNFNGTLDVQ